MDVGQELKEIRDITKTAEERGKKAEERGAMGRSGVDSGSEIYGHKTRILVQLAIDSTETIVHAWNALDEAISLSRQLAHKAMDAAVETEQAADEENGIE